MSFTTAPSAVNSLVPIQGQQSTHFCLSCLYCCVHSSNSFWFISMKSFKAL